MHEEKEVYIWWFIIYMKYLVDMMPLRIRSFIIIKLMADGMKTFVGRHGDTNTMPSCSLKEAEKK